MDQRLKDILQLFIDSGGEMTGTYLSHSLEVSSRTIRDDIKKLNALLDTHGAQIVSQRGKGYTLTVEKQELFDEFIANQLLSYQVKRPDSSTDRVKYVLNALLFQDDYLKIDDLADELFVSRTTIQSDIKKVREILKKYALVLHSAPHKGIKLMGSELNKRFAISEYALDRTSNEPEVYWIQELSRLYDFDSEELVKIWRALIELSTDNGIVLSDMVSNNLFVHLIIAMKRIKDGHEIAMVETEFNQLKTYREFEVATKIVHEVGCITGVDFPESEIAYVTIHLLGVRSTASSLKEEDGIEEYLGEEIYRLTQLMVSKIDEDFNLDLNADRELMLSLGLHLKPALNRYKYHMNIRNPLLEEIKSNYPLAFECALTAAMVLSEQIGVSISEHEIAYIALHIGAAIERYKMKASVKRCYLVCSTGLGSSQLLKYKIESEMASKIKVIGTTEYYNVKQIPFESIDMIISTIPIEETLPVPVITVNAIFGQQDLTKIQHFLHIEQSTIHQYVEPSLVHLNQHLYSKEEVIEFLAEIAAEYDDLPGNFEDYIWQREAIAATAYGNLVAIPHPIEPCSTKTFVVFCTLKRAIDWNGKQVRVVCLLNIQKDSSEELKDLYELLITIVNDPRIVKKVVKSSTYEEFIESIS